MRKLIPVSQLSSEQMDGLRERVELDLKNLAISERGGSLEDWKVRDLLPWTDLTIVHGAQAGDTTDFWGLGAIAASTLQVYVNHVLDDDEFVAIYGIALRDTTPACLKVKLQVGVAASTLAVWGLEELLSSDIPIALSPEAVYYRGSKRVYIQVMPDTVGKAVGADGISDHLVLIGVIAERVGEVISK